MEVLKEFHTILLGQKINVCTNHKNLIHKDHNDHRVIRWQLLLEEHGPEFICIKGVRNIAADAMSHLETAPSNVAEATTEEETTLLGTEDCHSMQVMASFLGHNDAKPSIICDEDCNELHMAECFANNKKQVEKECFPLDHHLIDEHQHKDKAVLKHLHNDVHSISTFHCGGNQD